MIEILNFHAGDVVEHSIVYLFGTCYDLSNKIQVTINSEPKNTNSWEVKNCFFKVFFIYLSDLS